jgi:hypothetical protein
LVCESAFALVLWPKNTELSTTVKAVVPSAIKRPESLPRAMLQTPVVLNTNEFVPTAVLFIPVVLSLKEL